MSNKTPLKELDDQYENTMHFIEHVLKHHLCDHCINEIIAGYEREKQHTKESEYDTLAEKLEESI